MQPEAGEPVADGLGLGDLVLMVREDQIHSASMDVELGAEIRLAHRDAFGVQPGLPRPHGVGQDGSPGFSPFHNVKSRSSRLPVRNSLTLVHVVDPMP